MNDDVSAETLFISLNAACRSPKAACSLSNIKIAVNTVLAGGRAPSMAAVAAVCVEKFGGPRYQSICNNKGYRAYINARFTEARAAALDARPGRLPVIEAEALIDLLRAQVAALTAENTRLRKAFRTLAPVPADRLLGKAVSGEAEQNSPALAAEEKRALRTFLDEAFDLGFDTTADGRLVTRNGLTLLGAPGMAALRRLCS